MIWGWIAAALFLSWIVCEKRVAWHHYIWMLLPIDMYGINIAGSTFKPYMIYGMIIIGYEIIKNYCLKLPKTVLFITILLLLSDAINGLIVASIMQHLMFLFVLGIACFYLNVQKGRIDFDEISTVSIATTIGYGFVFVVAYTLISLNIDLPGIYAEGPRTAHGMVISTSLTGISNELTTYRLRGFNIDPNVVVVTLVPGAALGLANILYKKKTQNTRNYLAVIFYFLVVYASGSRMAFLSSLIMLALMLFIGYKETNKKRIWILRSLIAALFLAILVVLKGETIFTKVMNDLTSFFSSRASMTGDAGRWTIWKYNFNYLVDNDCLSIGVGQNQILNYTVLGKACHNTWLEWICGTGLFIGMVINAWFIFAHKSIKRKCYEAGIDYLHDYYPIVLAYWIILIALTSVDNITNSAMLFWMILFRYGSIVPQEDNVLFLHNTDNITNKQFAGSNLNDEFPIR